MGQPVPARLCADGWPVAFSTGVHVSIDVERLVTLVASAGRLVGVQETVARGRLAPWAADRAEGRAARAGERGQAGARRQALRRRGGEVHAGLGARLAHREGRADHQDQPRGGGDGRGARRPARGAPPNARGSSCRNGQGARRSRRSGRPRPRAPRSGAVGPRRPRRRSSGTTWRASSTTTPTASPS